jgi:hypothetical protein
MLPREAKLHRLKEKFHLTPQRSASIFHGTPSRKESWPIVENEELRRRLPRIDATGNAAYLETRLTTVRPRKVGSFQDLNENLDTFPSLF